MKRMTRRTPILALACSLLFFLSWSPGGLAQEQSAEMETLNMALVEANTQFAFDLYRVLREDSGNLFFSPYSISSALAIAYAGARGRTARQMAEVLHFTQLQGAVHGAFGDLNANLVDRTEETDGVQLSIASALWGQTGYPFLDGYLDLLAAAYDAPMRSADFAGAAEQARIAVNDWVRDRTQGLIPELLAPDSITPATRLVLANAIYFLGTWEAPFDPLATQTAPFTRLDGTDVAVPMMHLENYFQYAEGPDFQAIELPYVGGQMAMTLVLPREGTFEAFTAGMTADWVDGMLAQMLPEKVFVSMPRFELSSDFALADVLSSLGMSDAFSGAADFSGMDGTRSLFIDSVVHKAFVSVDEHGTEAAAATGVMMTLSLPTTMRIDRPFVFLIRDLETETILFLGQVLDPTEG